MEDQSDDGEKKCAYEVISVDASVEERVPRDEQLIVKVK